MTTIITISDVEITHAKVRAILDSPSNDFVGDDTIGIKINMSYEYIQAETNLALYDTASIVNAVYNFAAWQIYMVYVESISEYIRAQTPTIVENRLETFRKIAMMYLKVIGIDLDGKDTALMRSSAQGVLTEARDLYSEGY